MAGVRRCQRPSSPLISQGSHHPTEVVTIQGEIRHRLMNPPVLTEPIRPPRLPRVLASVRRMLTLHQRRVDRPAAYRGLQHLIHRLLAPQHHPPMDRHDSAVLPLLVDRRVGQARIKTPLGQQRTTTRTGGLRGGVIAPVPRITRLFREFCPSNPPESPSQEESSLASMPDILETRCRSNGPPASPQSIAPPPVSRSSPTVSAVA